MKVITRELGPVQTNCYVVIEKHHALVIDPGGVFTDLEMILKDNEADLEAILLTHAHFDHIEGIESILRKHDVPVYLNPREFDFLKDPTLNVSEMFITRYTCQIQPTEMHEGKNTIGHFEVTALYTPGHSIGSMVFLIDQVMFSGDCLFQGSIGRTDMATGSMDQMMSSLEKLKKLYINYIVYPGHGPATTLAQEKQWNPYLR